MNKVHALIGGLAITGAVFGPTIAMAVKNIFEQKSICVVTPETIKALDTNKNQIIQIDAEGKCQVYNEATP